MPVVLSFEQKAYDANERVLELLAVDRIGELYAFLVFINPGSSTDEQSPPSQGWHRVFPPIPVTPTIVSGLRVRRRNLLGQRSPEGIGDVLLTIETLGAEQRSNEVVIKHLGDGDLTEDEASKLIIGKRFAPAVSWEFSALWV